MKVTFITTVNHNVGDDFIREGLKYLLRKYFQAKQISFTNIHKHSPITSRYGFEWIRSLKNSERLDKRIPLWLTPDRVMKSDLLVQSGAPVYWYHKGITDCVRGNEWYQPLIKERFLKKSKGTLVNLAAGTCQTYYSDGKEFLESEVVCDYIKEFHSHCKITTVRDKLAHSLLDSLNLKSEIIPCSSIFALDEYNLKDEGDEYVVVNYMSGGGHFTFGQEINFQSWEKSFREFYEVIKKEEKVIFSCHNEKEVQEAKKIDPAANIFYSKNFLDYMKFYSKAKFGFMNRIHAAYQLSSYGKQSIIIGADTRARMASEIGNKSYFVEEIDTEKMIQTYLDFKANRVDYKHNFHLIKHKAFERYMNTFSYL